MEDLYRQTIDENVRTLMQFPIVFQQSWLLSETMLPSEDATTSIKVKTCVRECLNALDTLSRISSELDLIRAGRSS